MKNLLLQLHFQLCIFFKQPYRILIPVLTAGVMLLMAHYNVSADLSVRPLCIEVIDLDRSPTSELLLRRLGENPNLEIVTMTDDTTRALSRADIDASFSILEGFEQNINAGAPSVSFHYLPQSMTAEISAEMFKRELVRLYTNASALQTIKTEYEKAGASFFPLLEQEIITDMERYWTGGLFLRVTQNSVSSAPQTPVFGRLTTAVLACMALLLLTLALGIPLVMQMESGLFKRFSVCRLSVCAYMFAFILPTMVLSLLAAALIGASGLISGYTTVFFALLIICACGLVPPIALICRETSNYILCIVFLSPVSTISGAIILMNAGYV